MFQTYSVYSILLMHIVAHIIMKNEIDTTMSDVILSYMEYCI
jgi:hypothetical protein